MPSELILTPWPSLTWTQFWTSTLKPHLTPQAIPWNCEEWPKWPHFPKLSSLCYSECFGLLKPYWSFYTLIAHLLYVSACVCVRDRSSSRVCVSHVLTNSPFDWEAVMHVWQASLCCQLERRPAAIGTSASRDHACGCWVRRTSRAAARWHWDGCIN